MWCRKGKDNVGSTTKIISVKESHSKLSITPVIITGEFSCSGGTCLITVRIPKRYKNKTILFTKFSCDNLIHFKIDIDNLREVTAHVAANSIGAFNLYFEAVNLDYWDDVSLEELNETKN